MATLELDTNSAKYIIRAYQPGLISINDHEYQASLIIMPEQLIHPWSPQTAEELQTQHLELFLTYRPEILLIGTGSTQAILPLSLYGHLINHGIGIEIMPTCSACYTYNALVAERRQVAAALLIR